MAGFFVESNCVIRYLTLCMKLIVKIVISLLIISNCAYAEPGRQRSDPNTRSKRLTRKWIHTYDSIPQHIQYKKFVSEAIGRECGYMLYLPPSYQANKSKRFPVVYWLPGIAGNPRASWDFINSINDAIKQKKAPEIIVVGVNGVYASMYCNSASGQFPMETVIIKDLISYIDKTYRTIATREKRAIEGFSMGGFGSARLGFKYTQLFGAVSIFSAAMYKAQPFKEKHSKTFEEIFNNDLEYFRQNSPWTIVKQNADKIKESGTAIRLFVGKNDRLVPKNTEFHQLLDSLGIKHEFGIIKDLGHNRKKLYKDGGGNLSEFYTKVFAE